MYEPMQTSVVLYPDFEFVPSKHLVKQPASWLPRLANDGQMWADDGDPLKSS